MRNLLVIIGISIQLVGCMSEEQVILPPASSIPPPAIDKAVNNKSREQGVVEHQIYPITLNLSRHLPYSSNSDYLQPLFKNLSNRSVYQFANSHKLASQYRFMWQARSDDKNKTVFALKRGRAPFWGYVTTSIGRNSVANAFVIDSEQRGRQYALVVKQMKVCLVTQASGAPRWKSDRWVFSKEPGSFECSGSTRHSVFNPESGFPRLLGPYYSETDTVFVFQKPAELKGIVSALKKQFPQLKIPIITSNVDL